MNLSSSTSRQAPPPLTENQRRALLNLLSDEDTEVYHAVRSRILACGSAALTWLRPQALSSDPLFRRRVQELIQQLARREADDGFLAFCLSHGENLDLEAGVWLLAQTQYPEINSAAYVALLDSYAADLRERLAGRHSPQGILAEINEYLFGVLAFRGNADHLRDPESSYLNRVMDRRTGNPISLCAVYWLLGRRLRLPIVGIGMPGHFLCRYQSANEALFIDAFHQGRLLTRADCIRYLQQSNHGFQESFLAPVSPGRALLRMCANLHQIYARLELREDCARVQRYVVALAR
jgi:regulator of sirC expression with transglutaminase-like and TPR domain